jgi:hypothetical protein
MSLREPLKIIGDILVEELSLTPGHIMLGFEKWPIPKEGLYIALAYLNPIKIIANNNYSISNGPNPDDGMTEVQELVARYLIQIDAMSFDNSARTRKEEIAQALHSVFSQQQQEINSVHLGRIPPFFNDMSSLEETAFLKRYTITVSMTALSRKQKTVSYYSDFKDPEVTINA